jgi:hypothetical protein
MRALEVLVNGRRVCLAGIGPKGIVSAIVDRLSGGHEERISLSVFGAVGTRHRRWATPAIGVGDEVLIRVLDAPEVDPPTQADP